MPLRKAYRLRWQPHGVSDSLDGNSSFEGAMASLANLVPDPNTNNSWVCRPNSVQLSSFSGLSSPGFQSGMLVVGDIMYGLIATGRNSGKDEPFAYNIATNTFLGINGITAFNVPASPPSSGDWTPPILAQVGSRIIVTHPGFPGGTVKFGWFDISGFVSSSITGATHSNNTLDGFSSNVLQAGWQIGMTITGTNIPANTVISDIASNGLSCHLSANATGTGSGIAFTVGGGTAVNPLWGAGDINLNNLPSVPLAVGQFNGRAYYACGTNGIVFSDSLSPCNRTFANQALTPANGLPVTAFGPVGTYTTLGGVVQALIAFQGVVAMQQITGDPATSNLAMNVVPVATGTNAPLSVVPTNFGLAFISLDGLRFVRPDGSVTDPVGDHGTGVSVPFIYALHSSRTCAAANSDTIRISVQNGFKANNPVEEYWYDITRKVWSGPHSFPASLIQSWRGTFVISPSGINAALFQSDTNPSSLNTGQENGQAMTFVWQPVLLPDDQDMMMIAIVESSLMVALGVSSVNVSALDEQGTLLDSLTIFGAISQTLWDSFNWDQAVWDSQGSNFRQRSLDWHLPLIAKQLTIQVQGNCNPQMRIGNLSLRYQRLGYQLQPEPQANVLTNTPSTTILTAG